MISPGEALRIGQVWLRSFGAFAPGEQALMGFPSDTIRDIFLDAMDDGALAVIWIRQKNGDNDWKDRFCGILRLERRAVLAPDRVAACRSVRYERQNAAAKASAMLEQVRKQRATQRLAVGDVTVNAVAAELGYQRQSSLTRAMIRWTGAAPTSFRSQAAG
jgi:hypothetical protein